MGPVAVLLELLLIIGDLRQQALKAAEAVLVAVQQGNKLSGGRQAHDEIRLIHGREVTNAHHGLVLLLVLGPADEGDAADVGGVGVQPGEALPAVLDLPQGRLA